MHQEFRKIIEDSGFFDEGKEVATILNCSLQKIIRQGQVSLVDVLQPLVHAPVETVLFIPHAAPDGMQPELQIFFPGYWLQLPGPGKPLSIKGAKFIMPFSKRDTNVFGLTTMFDTIVPIEDGSLAALFRADEGQLVLYASDIYMYERNMSMR